MSTDPNSYICLYIELVHESKRVEPYLTQVQRIYYRIESRTIFKLIWFIVSPKLNDSFSILSTEK